MTLIGLKECLAMSSEEQKYKKVIEILNSVSPSFCLAKWFNVSIHIPTGQTHSCYHPRSHKVPLEEVQANPGAIHNTIYKKSQRKLMLEGERPKECEYCWTRPPKPSDCEPIQDVGTESLDR